MTAGTANNARSKTRKENARGHLDTAGQHVLRTPDGLAERLVLPSRGEVERLAPPVLVEVGHKVVETNMCEGENSST